MSELKPRIHDEATGLDYALAGDYHTPVIELSGNDDRLIGKCGRIHQAYLEETNPLLLNHLILTVSDKFRNKGASIQTGCVKMLKQFIPKKLQFSQSILKCNISDFVTNFAQQRANRTVVFLLPHGATARRIYRANPMVVWAHIASYERSGLHP